MELARADRATACSEGSLYGAPSTINANGDSEAKMTPCRSSLQTATGHGRRWPSRIAKD